MQTAIQAEIQKVQKLSKYLRAGCTYLMVVLALIFLGLSLLVFFTDRRTGYDFGAFRVQPGETTPAIEAWSLVLLAALLAVLLNALVHLRALFVSFIAGRIYTSENVAHIRHLGHLALLCAFWQLAQPLIDVALLMSGLFDESMAQPGTMARQVAEGHLTLQMQGGIKTLAPFMMAGVVMLASWIMEVGRRTSEEAERLRHEAELVV